MITTEDKVLVDSPLSQAVLMDALSAMLSEHAVSENATSFFPSPPFLLRVDPYNASQAILLAETFSFVRDNKGNATTIPGRLHVAVMLDHELDDSQWLLEACWSSAVPRMFPGFNFKA